MVLGMLRDEISHLSENKKVGFLCHCIGLRENLQETPIFDGKIDGFRLRFPLNQSIVRINVVNQCGNVAYH